MANKKHLFIRSYIFMLLFLEISIFCSGQALIQNVSETIQTASNREFSNSKGGPENNKLSDVKGNARGGEYAFMHYVNKKGERSELAMARTEIGSEYWYGWSMLVPEDFDFSGSYSIVAQWASYPSPRNGKFKCGANGSYMVITAEGALEFRLQFAGKNEDSDCLKFVLIENISKYRG
ncbi:MAG: heparin lyase I family protein, partial [Bacteroidales bacterium]